MASSLLPDKSMRSSLRQMLLFLFVVALVSVGVGVPVVISRRVFEAHDTFSAVWQAHDMLTNYMHTNKGEWPQNWDDLQQSFSVTNSGYGVPDLEWVRARVSVDFGFNPKAFASSTQQHDGHFHILHLADGTENRETQEANQRLKSTVLSRDSW